MDPAELDRNRALLSRGQSPLLFPRDPDLGRTCEQDIFFSGVQEDLEAADPFSFVDLGSPAELLQGDVLESPTAHFSLDLDNISCEAIPLLADSSSTDMLLPSSDSSDNFYTPDLSQLGSEEGMSNQLHSPMSPNPNASDASDISVDGPLQHAMARNAAGRNDKGNIIHQDIEITDPLLTDADASIPVPFQCNTPGNINHQVINHEPEASVERDDMADLADNLVKWVYISEHLNFDPATNGPAVLERPGVITNFTDNLSDDISFGAKGKDVKKNAESQDLVSNRAQDSLKITRNEPKPSLPCPEPVSITKCASPPRHTADRPNWALAPDDPPKPKSAQQNHNKVQKNDRRRSDYHGASPSRYDAQNCHTLTAHSNTRKGKNSSRSSVNDPSGLQTTPSEAEPMPIRNFNLNTPSKADRVTALLKSDLETRRERRLNGSHDTGSIRSESTPHAACSSAPDGLVDWKTNQDSVWSGARSVAPVLDAHTHAGFEHSSSSHWRIYQASLRATLLQDDAARDTRPERNQNETWYHPTAAPWPSLAQELDFHANAHQPQLWHGGQHNLRLAAVPSVPSPFLLDPSLPTLPREQHALHAQDVITLRASNSLNASTFQSNIPVSTRSRSHRLAKLNRDSTQHQNVAPLNKPETNLVTVNPAPRFVKQDHASMKPPSRADDPQRLSRPLLHEPQRRLSTTLHEREPNIRGPQARQNPFRGIDGASSSNGPSQFPFPDMSRFTEQELFEQQQQHTYPRDNGTNVPQLDPDVFRGQFVGGNPFMESLAGWDGRYGLGFIPSQSHSNTDDAHSAGGREPRSSASVPSGVPTPSHRYDNARRDMLLPRRR